MSINGLLLCTAVTIVKLHNNELCNEGLERLLPAFYNTSVTTLNITSSKNIALNIITSSNKIQGHRGGELIRDLLVGNNTMLVLNLNGNPIGSVGAIGMGQGIAGNYRLQKLYLSDCNMGNDGLANLVLSMGELTNHVILTDLGLAGNHIEGTQGGRLVSLLLQRFPALRVLSLDFNNIGPRGCRALAPVLTLPKLVLERLSLQSCNLGNDGVVNLIPDGEVNRSLSFLDLNSNGIQDLVGRENVVALAARCTTLDRLVAHPMSPYQHRRLNLLLERKRLHTEAHALGSSPPAVVFEKLLQANSNEHGLSASFVILRDYIFAEQRKLSEQVVQAAATGLKRKR